MGFQNNENFFDFMFLLVDYGKVLCFTVNKLQHSSDALFTEEYKFQEYSPFCSRFITCMTVFTFDLCGLLCFVCHS